MPLRDGGVNAYRYEAGVEFGMTDQDKSVVRVRVSHEALDDIEATTARGRDYLGIFNKHRTRIADVASGKYDAVQLESDGIIPVRASDLNP